MKRVLTIGWDFSMQKMIRKMKVNKRDIFCGKNWSSSMALRMLSTQIKIINLFVLSDNKADSKLFDKTLRALKSSLQNYWMSVPRAQIKISPI